VRISFRTDSSNLIGSGHVIRCLKLAKELKSRGHEIFFISRDHEGNLIDLIEENFQVYKLSLSDKNLYREDDDYQNWLGEESSQDMHQTIEIIKELKIDVLVVDHYGISSDWELGIKKEVQKLVVIDDIWTKDHCCDVLINHNYTDRKNNYSSSLYKDTKLLLGPKFAIIDEEYKKLADQKHFDKDKLENILIYFGNSDLYNLTKIVLKILLKPKFKKFEKNFVVSSSNSYLDNLLDLAKKDKKLNVFFDLPNLVNIMNKSDICIGAGGVTNLERLCVGLPSVVIAVADNQLDSCQSLKNDGFIYFLGEAKDINSNDIYDNICKIFNSTDDLKNKSLKGKSLVDGNGIKRIVKHIED
tara:strand:- start:10253 stop:11323 length:1071 start_codon:yes stop_codon:yes gene_type:complete